MAKTDSSKTPSDTPATETPTTETPATETPAVPQAEQFVVLFSAVGPFLRGNTVTQKQLRCDDDDLQRLQDIGAIAPLTTAAGLSAVDATAGTLSVPPIMNLPLDPGHPALATGNTPNLATQVNTDALAPIDPTLAAGLRDGSAANAVQPPTAPTPSTATPSPIEAAAAAAAAKDAAGTPNSATPGTSAPSTPAASS